MKVLILGSLKTASFHNIHDRFDTKDGNDENDREGEIASSWTMMLCQVMEKELAANIQASRTMSLMRSSNFVFEVQCSDTNVGPRVHSLVLF